MPTPPKPVNVIRLEGKSHRTKREVAERAKAGGTTADRKDTERAERGKGK